jgi:hypothetical protein
VIFKYFDIVFGGVYLDYFLKEGAVIVSAVPYMKKLKKAKSGKGQRQGQGQG